MHIHGSSMNFNQTGLSAAAGAERAAAAQRAAEARKKLAAATTGAASDPEETLMLSQWSETQSAGANPLSIAGRSPDFRE